jgi:hypothetical protein
VWPWEHLAFGYVLWTVSVRLVRRRPARPAEAVAIAFGTQVPDLVDKPLAWTFDVLPSGVSLAHSLAFALPATAAAFVLGRRTGRTGAAAAFAVAYASHLAGDALYPLVRGGSVSARFVLWPLVPASPPATEGLLRNVVHYLHATAATLVTVRGLWYLAAEVALVGGAFALWALDGAPGLPAALRRPDRP